MVVSLTDELEQFIRSKVASGYFQDASEVVRAALCGMIDADGGVDPENERFRADIQQGWEQGQAGELISSAEAKSQMARFKEGWVNSQATRA
jgi:antitoxin ParD1/3/4